jgi:hypothetical protein
MAKTVCGQGHAFQLVRETKGAEATPSGWQPGKPRLEVEPDPVSNVWKVWSTDLAFWSTPVHATLQPAHFRG